ncbi:MAG: NAD-dependent epimerase/dehydratase family protein [Bdellovibrionota bacterium]
MSLSLVTGATGLLGANIVRALVARGEKVRAFVFEDSIALKDLPIETIRGDVRDKESVAAAMKGVTNVYHVAAVVSLWAPDPEPMRKVNVGGTRNVFEAALRAGVRRALQVSTVDALGLRTPGRPADEDVPFGTGHAVPTAYATTKHEAEQTALSFLSKGLEVVVVNPTYMLGAWDTRPTSGRILLEIAKGRVVGYPSGGNNFVDVEDVAEAALTAMEKGTPGRRYILGNENMTYRAAFRLFAEIVGARPPLFPIPHALASLGGRLGEQVGHWTKREPFLHVAAAESGYMDHYFDPSRARRELGLRRTPVQVAAERAWRWFCDHGYR